MSYKFSAKKRAKYFGIFDFMKKFPDENACFEYLYKEKYPDGYLCSCGAKKFYRLKNPSPKYSRILQCSNCKKQTSITAGTVFQASKLPLLKLFLAVFLVTQTKKGISANLLAKHLKVAHTTALLLLQKLRREMQEDAASYQIGGENKIVEADEIEIGGEKSQKQRVLMLLEINKSRKLGRVRLNLIQDAPGEAAEALEKTKQDLISQIAKGTTIHINGDKSYIKMYFHGIKHIQIKYKFHRQEEDSRKFLRHLHIVAENLEKWYRGIHHSFALRNTAYYLNEYSYRFNRRRSEINIFERLMNRSIHRPNILTQKKFFEEKQYLPLAA